MLSNLFVIQCILYTFLQLTSLYNLSFENIEGETVDMHQCQGKKVLISTFDSRNPDLSRLKLLNNIFQANREQLIAIVVPVNNSDSAVDNNGIKALLVDSLQVDFTISKPGKSNKSEGVNQHVLLQWLTHVDDNGHFDNDVNGSNQMFLINENGALYDLFDESATYTLLDDAIREENLME